MEYEAFLLRGYVSPNDAGIMGDSDSASIQNAVDAALACGIGKVVIPKYNARTHAFGWEIDKSILLDANLTVVLDDCYMRMADDVYENFFRTNNLFGENGLDTSRELEHIEILGQGNATLDGGKANDLTEETRFKDGRPHVALNTPILFFNVRYFRVSNLSVINQRYWGMRFEFCKCGRISDILFCALDDRHNQDGINLRNGCHDIVIENIHAQTGDDSIALSALDVRRDDRWNLVDESQDNDIHSVLIRNISGCAMTHPLVALRCHNGAKIYDIQIEEIHDTEPLRRVAVRRYTKANPRDEDNPVKAEPRYFMDMPRYSMVKLGDSKYFAIRPAEMGDMRNIQIRNITSRYSERAVVFGSNVRDVRIENITVGGVCRFALSTFPKGYAGGPDFRAENIEADGIVMEGDADEETAVLYTADMLPGGYIRNMRIRNVTADNITHFAHLGRETGLELENIRITGLKAEFTKVENGCEDQVRIRIKE